MGKLEELARCEKEQQELLQHPLVLAGKAPAWLFVLGWEDWEMEKRLILQEAHLTAPTIFTQHPSYNKH